MTASDEFELVTIASLVAPVAIIFIWAHRVNRRAYPTTPTGFGGMLLVFVFYLTIINIPFTTVGLFAFLAHNSSDLRAGLAPLLILDAVFSSLIIALHIVSAVLLFMRSSQFVTFYWRAVCAGIIFVVVDTCASGAYALIWGDKKTFLRFLIIAATNPQMIFGNILLPLLSGLYVLNSKRVANTFMLGGQHR